MSKNDLFPIRTTVPRRRVAFSSALPSATKQHLKQECDINFIMEKYQKTGILEHFNKHQAEYGYAPATDFREALETVKRGETLFNALPSSLRSKFENDPAQFLEFVQNPENLEEARSLGLANPATTQQDLAAPAASPSAKDA